MGPDNTRMEERITENPPMTPDYGAVPLRPHRGGVILALGIIGLVVCLISGIVAWVMASGDLREMAAGRMDRSGEGLTRAGKICGIISVCLQGGVILLYAVVLIIFIVGSIAAAGSSGG